MSIGAFNGGAGYYQLSGGTLIVGDSEKLGDQGAGTFDQSSGTHTVGVAGGGGTLSLGATVSGNGTYLLSGDGVLNVKSVEQVGMNGAGTFIQSGGTHTAGVIYIGWNPGSNGTTCILSDGTLIDP